MPVIANRSHSRREDFIEFALCRDKPDKPSSPKIPRPRWLRASPCASPWACYRSGSLALKAYPPEPLTLTRVRSAVQEDRKSVV